MLTRNLLSLWDIMQEFRPTQLMHFVNALKLFSEQCDDGRGWLNENIRPGLDQLLIDTADFCGKIGLPVSEVTAKRVEGSINDPAMKAETFRWAASSLETTIQNECDTVLFFSVDAAKRRHFDRYTEGFEDAVQRFPDLIPDIEEMRKCYALGRYAASVFHSVHADELALIEVGKFLRTADPKSGWTATAIALEQIVKKKHQDRTPFEQQHSAFLEQLHGTVEGLKNAWRNKISHAQGRLVLMTVDFSGEVAEDILFATRSFLRRIATELPTE